MSTADIINEREGSTLMSTNPAWQHLSNSYQCRVRLCPEEEGGFSVFALNLPGAASQGETEEEALANIREACTGAIKSYMDRDGKIPWEEVEVEDYIGAKEFWVVVNA